MHEFPMNTLVDQSEGTESAAFSEAPSIAAVVVTFNRKHLLVECLDALLSQERPVDRIFVIDQASTDGTGELLEARGYLRSPVIVYARFLTNTGGAGGFSRGVELAYQGGFDWIWLMDDDAIARPQALARMMPLTQVHGIIAIANAKLRTDGTLDRGHLTFSRRVPRHGSSPPELTFSSFVGLMVASSAVRSIGYPKSELFLQGDDTEYCRRLCSIGRIAFAEDAILVHKEVFRPAPNKRRFGRKFVVYPPETFCFRYFLWRNRVWIELHSPQFRLWRSLRVMVQVMKEFARTCLVDRTDLSLRLSVLIKAMRDGLTGRFDNDFPFRMRDRITDSRKLRNE